MDEKQYVNIPKYYDQLMASVPYKYWADYIEEIFKLLNFCPKSLLDVACGTGSMTKEFFDAGLEVAGIDLSEGMISYAKEKYPDIDFYVQDAKDINLNRKFDVAISLFDSLNYIIDKSNLQLVFKKVYEHLNENGYFIFDVNTIYALSNNFFRQSNLEEGVYPHYIWKPRWDPSTRLCTVDMIFECKDTDGKVVEFKEKHVQKGYKISELSRMLELAGFEVVDVFNAYLFTKPNRRSDRVYYVAKKI